MKAFNVRVYGLLINERREVLISDECLRGYAFTKFPGGGLEFGEGLADGLKREFEEELGKAVEVGELFYVNDFYLHSAFNENHQLICIYYFVHCEEWRTISLGTCSIPLKEDGEQQRWLPVEQLSADLMTFPIDKVVAEKLKAYATEKISS